MIFAGFLQENKIKVLAMGFFAFLFSAIKTLAQIFAETFFVTFSPVASQKHQINKMSQKFVLFHFFRAFNNLDPKKNSQEKKTFSKIFH